MQVASMYSKERAHVKLHDPPDAARSAVLALVLAGGALALQIATT